MLTPSAMAPTLRVAIYRTSSLGDVVLATACLDLLEKLAIPFEVTWLGRGPALEMITRSWPKVKGLEIGRTESLVELQRVTDHLANHHLFVDLQCNLRSSWIARALKSAHGIPYFSTHKAQVARSRLLLEARLRGRRRPLPETARHPVRMQFEMMCDTLKQALEHHLPVEMRDGIAGAVPRPKLPIPDDFASPWRKELHFGTWVAVAPGAAHATKRAPVPMLRRILETVRQALLGADGQQLPVGLAFLGDSKDRQHALDIMAELNWTGPIMNLAGKLALWESAVALREVTVLLTNDSVLAHIAEAVDTPAAVLFGPTVEGFGFPPRMAESRAFSSLVGCRPCSKHGKNACRFGDRLCFSTIPPEEVARHLLSRLAAAPTRAGHPPAVQSTGRPEVDPGSRSGAPELHT